MKGLESDKPLARQRPGPSADKADGEQEVLAALAEMPPSDRAIGERLHAIIRASVPALSPKLWYGMPAYAKDGKVICFFQSARKYTRNGRLRLATGRAPWMTRARYATLGFGEAANLDDDGLWAVGFAVTEVTPAVEARIDALVKKAVS